MPVSVPPAAPVPVVPPVVVLVVVVVEESELEPEPPLFEQLKSHNAKPPKKSTRLMIEVFVEGLLNFVPLVTSTILPEVVYADNNRGKNIVCFFSSTSYFRW
jgi:hypothetical protein